MKPRKVTLLHNRAPGDTLVLTGLVRDIALSHPGEFEISVHTSAPDFWRHNPYIVPRPKNPTESEQYKISYGQGLRDQNRETVHFMPYFHRVFNKRYGTNVRVHYPFPDVHLSEEERHHPLVSGRYWIVISGGKSDFTCKVWSTRYFQETVNRLRDIGIPCVQIGSSDRGHWHPPLDNALDMIGETNLRDVARLIHHADGVICGVTMAMHLAAALQRPCVCLAGGREAWWWEAYVNENRGLGEASGTLRVPHRFLHTMGQLDCCKVRGCWRNKVVAGKDKSVCLKVTQHGTQPLPVCMDMITPTMVVNSVLSYYYDGTLPPVPGTSLEQDVQALRAASRKESPDAAVHRQVVAAGE